MSLDVSELQASAPEAENTSSPAEQSAAPGRRARPWSTLAPVAAALVVLVIDRLISNADSGVESILFQRLLYSLVALTAVAALASFALPAIARRYVIQAPLITAGIGLVEVWSLVTTKFALLPMPYFPGPELVLTGMVEDQDTLRESTLASLKLLTMGYVMGVAAGFGTGVLLGWFHRARYWGVPLLKLLGPVPPAVFVPLAFELFHEPFYSGAALIALAVWFPMTMLTMSGIANVPASYFDVARTLGARRSYLVFRVAIPAAMPTVFIGLFMGLAVAFLTLLVAETVGVKSGLAWYIKWQQQFLEYHKAYAAILIMAVLFSSILTLMFKLRDRLLAWQKGVIRW